MKRGLFFTEHLKIWGTSWRQRWSSVIRLQSLFFRRTIGWNNWYVLCSVWICLPAYVICYIFIIVKQSVWLFCISIVLIIISTYWLYTHQWSWQLPTHDAISCRLMLEIFRNYMKFHVKLCETSVKFSVHFSKHEISKHYADRWKLGICKYY